MSRDKKIQLVKYRDAEGYIIDGPCIIYHKHRGRVQGFSGGYQSANLVWCPERAHLLALDHCESCPLFVQYAKTGVDCKSQTPVVLPDWANKTCGIRYISKDNQYRTVKEHINNFEK